LPSGAVWLIWTLKMKPSAFASVVCTRAPQWLYTGGCRASKFVADPMGPPAPKTRRPSGGALRGRGPPPRCAAAHRCPDIASFRCWTINPSHCGPTQRNTRDLIQCLAMSLTPSRGRLKHRGRTARRRPTRIKPLQRLGHHGQMSGGLGTLGPTPGGRENGEQKQSNFCIRLYKADHF
jgi:hypothetical protein